MKQVSVFLLLCSLLFAACKKNSSGSEVYGVLTGPDPTLCGCCGGIFIEINSQKYRLDSVPAGLNGPYPVNVALTYTPLSKCPGFNYIKSDDIHIR